MPAFGSGPVFSVDHLAAGEVAGCADTVAPWWGSGRCLLRLVPAGAEAHRPRCRRHLRCGARRPAVAPVQCPLRRLRFPADRRLRPGWSLRHCAPAPGETAERPRDQGFSPPLGARDPGQLAAGGDPRPRRQPLRLPGSARLVRGERPRLRPRPRPDPHLEAPRRRPRGKHRRPKAAPAAGKVRRFKEFHDAAGSWSRVRRIIARVEAGADGADTRFIVTNLGHGSGRSLYQELYCRRGQAENHIKAWKTHLAADRTSCPKATANQFRLFLHAGAYWLLWSLRVLMPRRSSWRVAQFDTLRLRLIKVAARIVEMKIKIKVHLPTSAPDQAVIRLLLGRLSRLVT